MRMPIPFLISVGMLITMTFLSVGLWSALPPETMLPIHFGPSGEADRFARPDVALFLLPAVTLSLIVLLTLIAALKPKKIDKSPLLYAGVWIFTVLILAVGHGLIIRQALFALRP